MVVNFIPLSM